MTASGRLALTVSLAMALALSAVPTVGQARGATQRESAVIPRQNDANTARQSRVLLDRFAQRAGQALQLSDDQTRRLRNELQTSREMRARITAQVRVVRQELMRLARESSTDEARIERLLDEAVQLEVRAAEISVDEQRRLAEFLTPTQRVRILWLRQRMLQQALQPRDSLRVDEPPGFPDGN